MTDSPMSDERILRCLACLADGLVHAELPAACPESVLRDLLDRGLVETVPGPWLPLEMKRIHYRLTPRGRDWLAGHG